MKMVVNFEQKGKLLSRFEKIIKKPDDYKEAIEEAFAFFRRHHPKVLLFDGVTVTFDKEED